MGMREYGCYEVKVSEDKLREICPEGFSKLDKLAESKGLEFQDFCEAWREEYTEDEEYSVVKEIVDCVEERTGVEVYPVHVSEDADIEGDTDFWATGIRLAPEIEKLGGEIVAWSEFG